MAVYATLIFFLVICNPAVAKIGLRFFGEDRWAYMRIFYLLPLMTIIAYAITEWYTEHVQFNSSVKKKTAYILVIIVTVVLCGEVYPSSMYKKAENIYKIDQDALEMSDFILEDSSGEEIYVLLPEVEDIVYGVRQYTGKIIVSGFSEGLEDTTRFQNALKEKSFTYIVFPKTVDATDSMRQGNFYRVGETEQYYIYKKAVE
ncbi:MAG: hypothetical protein PUB52_10350 [Lachnospiraceae bacterium]|nr:hypothetical protein [Lachnospiraceae bacterium]